jgi:hypothetical protein
VNADFSSIEERVLAALQRIANTDWTYGEPLATGNTTGSVYMRCRHEVNADETLPPIGMLVVMAAMANLWKQGKIANGPLYQTFWVASDQPSLVAA